MKLCYNVLVCLIVLHYFCCSNNCFILSGNSGWWKQNLHVPWLEIIPTINAHCAICFPYFPKKLFSICIPPLSFVADILAHFLWLRTKNFWTVVFCRWTVNVKTYCTNNHNLKKPDAVYQRPVHQLLFLLFIRLYYLPCTFTIITLSYIMTSFHQLIFNMIFLGIFVRITSLLYI